ncbi:hypothetical protein Mal52_39770 [Symmachiella dynata]|uniref:Uncharacterized protein n=2 Tax=Symmachiella dynata TaxID=2527995 RepID=A0A517ZSQ2_9PLAN|nr:hypothetical protein Mal52_39770 [Symmachiella dynata]
MHLMQIEPLEVYCRDSNYAIVKPPGRKFPGAVIQGDSLAILAYLANQIAMAAAENRATGDTFLGHVEELNNLLVDRILHYQEVLQNHEIDFPHSPKITPSQLVNFFPLDDEETVAT